MGVRTVPLSDTIDDTQSKPRRTSTRNAADKKLKDSLSGVYVSGGMALHGVGLIRGDIRFQAAGQNFVEKSDSIAETWMKLADSNPRIKSALRTFVETSAAAELIGLHVACLAPIAVGVVPPAFMEAMRNSEPSQNGHGNDDS